MIVQDIQQQLEMTDDTTTTIIEQLVLRLRKTIEGRTTLATD
jgi:hypothetical protein